VVCEFEGPLLLKMPVFWPLFEKAAITRFMRNLSTTTIKIHNVLLQSKSNQTMLRFSFMGMEPWTLEVVRVSVTTFTRLTINRVPKLILVRANFAFWA